MTTENNTRAEGRIPPVFGSRWDAAKSSEAAAIHLQLIPNDA